MKTIVAVFHVALTVLCLGFLPEAQAVVPPPDGGYPNFTTAEGTKALQNLTTGTANTGLGWYSLFTNSTASYNTAVGAGTLALNNADENTATGTAALFLNTTGTGNTANGAFALLYNNGNGNTAVGDSALFENTGGGNNTAVGRAALLSNTTASDNTAVGAQALFDNTTGDNNSAFGQNALGVNTTGFDNTAVGAAALQQNETGAANTAIGFGALSTNVGGDFAAGSNNTAVGEIALQANTTGYSNTALGVGAGGSVTTANNVICIGVGVGGANVNSSCYIGNIWQQTGGSQAVYVNSEGKLGAQVSSQRFKDEIKPMEQASEAIYSLKPVSFRYKPEIEPARPSSFGLIAEDVEAVSPELVLRDKEGKPYSVRYDQVNAMLLNEFLKEHRKNEEQEAKIAELKKTIDTVLARLNEQNSKSQKVDNQLEISTTDQYELARDQ